jgi:hypothetical protein
MYDESTCLVFFIHFILCEIYNIFYNNYMCERTYILEEVVSLKNV